MGALLATIGGWLARRVASWGLGGLLSLSFLGPLAPIVTAVANSIGAVITAVFEILVALSKSPEGRVTLAFAAAGLGFLYLRFHYIEEGKAMVHPKTVYAAKPCPSAPPAAGARRRGG